MEIIQLTLSKPSSTTWNAVDASLPGARIFIKEEKETPDRWQPLSATFKAARIYVCVCVSECVRVCVCVCMCVYV